MTSFKERSHIRHMDNAQLSLMDVNSLILTLLFELCKEATAKDDPQEWVQNLFGFIRNLNV